MLVFILFFNLRNFIFFTILVFKICPQIIGHFSLQEVDPSFPPLSVGSTW